MHTVLGLYLLSRYAHLELNQGIHMTGIAIEERLEPRHSWQDLITKICAKPNDKRTINQHVGIVYTTHFS